MVGRMICMAEACRRPATRGGGYCDEHRARVFPVEGYDPPPVTRPARRRPADWTLHALFFGLGATIVWLLTL